jgi:predicted signal transduction protein with EAL and GGDEF domain
LLASEHEVAAVLTRPDARSGRGRRTSRSPVAERADAAGIPVLTPRSPREPEFLEQLAALGVRLAVDDFGTGYSSLAYLKRLPVHEIKVDRSFVLGMGDDGGDRAIVRSTIELGRSLGLDVVGEGVESGDVLVALRSLGCRFAQGFGIACPLPADEVTAWAADRRVAPLGAPARARMTAVA